MFSWLVESLLESELSSILHNKGYVRRWIVVEQSSVPSKKKDPTIWIVLGIVVVLLCCLLALCAVGLVLLLDRLGQQDFSLPGISPTPTATPQPGATQGIVVEPFRPTTRRYPTLQELVPGWEASTSPATQTWELEVRANQPVLVLLGWCTDTAETLDQNYEHIRYSLVVDGREVDVYSLYRDEGTISGGVCRSYLGIIRRWPEGKHTITTTMEITETIHDGWSEYPAGKYTDVYEITVIP